MWHVMDVLSVLTISFCYYTTQYSIHGYLCRGLPPPWDGSDVLHTFVILPLVPRLVFHNSTHWTKAYRIDFTFLVNDLPHYPHCPNFPSEWSQQVENPHLPDLILLLLKILVIAFQAGISVSWDFSLHLEIWKYRGVAYAPNSFQDLVISLLFL